MNKINKEWHLANKMPKNPSFGERMRWHIAHAENCACREISGKLKVDLENWKKANHV